MKKAIHYISPIKHREQASPVSGRLGNRGAAVVGNAEINCSNLEGL